MLLEMAIGDSYGACFECTSNDFVERNNDLRYEIHPRILKKYPADNQPKLVPSGCYTDDTQMSLGIVEMMLDKNFDWYDKEAIADVFLECFKRDERRGYTPYLFLILINSRSGKELLSKLSGDSDKSGAFMRAAPIGMYSDLDEVMEKAALQAMVTHDSWVGRNSAIGAAMMAHYFYHDLGPKDEMVQWLKDTHFKHTLFAEKPFWVPSDKGNPDNGGKGFGVEVKPWKQDQRVRVHGWDCFEAAVYVVNECDTMSDVLHLSVALGGDSDTVATVAAAVASCSKEISQDIPVQLIEGLENGSFGHKFLADLDLQLKEAFPCGG